MLYHIVDTKEVKILKTYYSKKPKKGALTVLSHRKAMLESQICYLVYNYYSHLPISKLLDDINLTNLWNSAVKFTDIMITSSNLTTKIWLLEILY